MRYSRVLLLSAGVCLAAACGANAEQPGRFTMTPVDEGMLRFDTHSGALSLCRRQDDQWSCALVPESHLDLQRDLERLKQENAALRSKLELLKSNTNNAPEDAAAKKQDRIILKPPVGPPDDETIDEMMSVLEKMVRRFQDMIESLQKKPAEKEKQL